MVRSDRDVRARIGSGRVVIDPFDPECVQPSSVDLHRGEQFLVFHDARRPYIDPREPIDDLTERIVIAAGECSVLGPGEFASGTSHSS